MVASWGLEEGAEREEGGNLPFGGGGLGGTCCLSQGEQSCVPYHDFGEGVGGSRDGGYLRNGFSSVSWSDPLAQAR